MFNISDTKTFMDSVHGYINVPKCFVTNIIDTEAFQRLRNIDQTGMRILYPNAKHDRFSHSLGVFHLGCKAVDALLDNFKKDNYWRISSDNNSIEYWAKNKVLFLIACLLHDIGHTPFSHSLEKLVLDNSIDDNGVQLSDRLVAKINEFEEDPSERINIESIGHAAAHEMIGSLLILEHFSQKIDNILDELIAMQYPTTSSSGILYAEHYQYNPVIKKDLEHPKRDVCFVVRMILGLKYKEYKPEKQIRNSFITLLNGSNFDVDKLDYIIRDTKMSGISNIGIDVERLLGAVSIITTTKCKGPINEHATKDDVISDLFGDETSNIHITGKFCGTIMLFSNCSVEIYANSSFVSLITLDQGKIRYSNATLANFSSDTFVSQNDEEITWPGPYKTLPALNGKGFKCQIKNASLLEDSSFSFTAEPSQASVVELQIKDWCDLRIKGKFKILSPISCIDQVSLEGTIQTAVFLRDLIHDRVPCEQVYNEFVVGFSKQAINIIANVLEARDYLYLWVYAHHKVIYYANFLIPALAKKVLPKASRKRYPRWNLDYNDIMFIDDAYVWSVIKYCYHSKRYTTSRETYLLFDELFNRKYKTSLYKSLAEYDLTFEAFSDAEKYNSKRYLTEHCRTEDSYPKVASDTITAGYLDDEILNQINQHPGLENIKSIIYVDASYSAKRINAKKTFIKFANNSVAAISEIPLLSDHISKVGNTNHYFYLYYETKTPSLDKKMESEMLKNALVGILKNNS